MKMNERKRKEKTRSIYCSLLFFYFLSFFCFLVCNRQFWSIWWPKSFKKNFFKFSIRTARWWWWWWWFKQFGAKKDTLLLCSILKIFEHFQLKIENKERKGAKLIWNAILARDCIRWPIVDFFLESKSMLMTTLDMNAVNRVHVTKGGHFWTKKTVD